MTTAISQQISTPQPARGLFAPLAESAFRVLGLAASASQREVYEAATRLRLALKVGVTGKFDGDLAWLAPLGRDEAQVRDALSRLVAPQERARERLFWFYDEAKLPAADSTAGVEAGAARLLAAGGPAATHDAALLLVAGLHRFDPDLDDPAAWKRAFQLWAELFTGEEFWSLLVAADLRGGFEQPVTFAEVAGLREGLPRLVAGPVAEYAKTAALGGRHEACRRALSILRAASLPAPLLAEHEDEIVGPFEDRLDGAFYNAFAGAEVFYGVASELYKHGAYTHALAQVERELKPRLRALLEVAGPEHPAVGRNFAEASRRIAGLAGGWLELGERGRALGLIKLAHAIALPRTPEREAARERLGELDPASADEREPASIDERELDSANEGDAASANRVEGASTKEGEPAGLYERAALRELARQMPDWLGVEPGGGGLSFRSMKQQGLGCLATALFYLMIIALCFMMDKCGITKLTGGPGRHRSSIEALKNFNMPVPGFTPYAPPEMPEFVPLRLTERVTIAELRELIRKRRVVVVDVRARADYDAGHIPGALWLPEEATGKEHRAVLRGKRRVVFYCDCAGEAAADRIAFRLRLDSGADVAVLEGGYRAWLESERKPGLTVNGEVSPMVVAPPDTNAVRAPDANGGATPSETPSASPKER